MRIRCRIVLLFAAAFSLAVATAYTQDSPSLGDLARQQRLHKEQSKAALDKDKNAKPVRVITNEEIPEHEEPVSRHAAGAQGNAASMPASSDEGKLPAEHWKSQIVAQKNQVASLQREIDELNESIRFAPANCVANCVGWNERQREKQQRAELMQAQLEEQKRRLDDMQESARKQGYGSSVYDP